MVYQLNINGNFTFIQSQVQFIEARFITNLGTNIAAIPNIVNIANLTADYGNGFARQAVFRANK